MRGEGEPVVIIQTALSVDELRHLAQRTAAYGPFRVVLYHRRGYPRGGSVPRQGSVSTEAADCRALTTTMDIGPAHVVGVSFSAAIVLTLASWAPDSAQSLTVIEPPPAHPLDVSPFRSANLQLLQT